MEGYLFGAGATPQPSSRQARSQISADKSIQYVLAASVNPSRFPAVRGSASFLNQQQKEFFA
jgi:hypothetical protein